MSSTVVAFVCLAANAFSCQQMPVRVIDGDTIVVRSEHIRLAGINAPEIKGQCADESAVALLAKERVVELVMGANLVIDRSGRDKYGRTLATVVAGDREIGKILVEEGLAKTWEKKMRPGLANYWCAQ